nr:DUF72 domain-containing protein [uncultured Dethiosulfovibrio sp.]
MINVRIGTCSWADRQLLSSGWYPPSAKDGESRLGHYSSCFDSVEVDSTFYAIPDITDVYRWASWTPPGFIFNVKAYGLFTFHSVQWTSLPRWVRDEIGLCEEKRIDFKKIPRSIRLELWHQFSESIMPLLKIGKLGYVLFQLPPWACFSDRMMVYLDRVVEEAKPFKIAFEVRNSTWLDKGNRDIFFERLRGHNIAYVAVDEPSLPWTVPAIVEPTASWGSVVRFHGRNKEAWSRGSYVGEKFRYLYSRKELEEWKEPVLGLAKKVDRLFLMFNNCWSDYSARSASLMQDITGQPRFGSQGELDLR